MIAAPAAGASAAAGRADAPSLKAGVRQRLRVVRHRLLAARLVPGVASGDGLEDEGGGGGGPRHRPPAGPRPAAGVGAGAPRAPPRGAGAAGAGAGPATHPVEAPGVVGAAVVAVQARGAE